MIQPPSARCHKRPCQRISTIVYTFVAHEPSPPLHSLSPFLSINPLFSPPDSVQNRHLRTSGLRSEINLRRQKSTIGRFLAAACICTFISIVAAHIQVRQGRNRSLTPRWSLEAGRERLGKPKRGIIGQLTFCPQPTITRLPRGLRVLSGGAVAGALACWTGSCYFRVSTQPTYTAHLQDRRS